MKEATADQKWYTVTQAARYLGKSRSWVCDQIAKGKLPRKFLGANVTIQRDDLDALVTKEPSGARRFE